VDRNLFVNGSCVTVTCVKDTPGHRVVVEKDRHQEIVSSLPPGVPIVEAASPEQALAMLDKGLAHVYISPSTLTSLYLIQKKGFQNIRLTGLPVETVSLSLAVRKDRVDLLTNLSVALGKIMDGRHYQELRKKWLGSGIEVNVWTRYIQYVLWVLAGLAAVLLVFAGWNFTLKRRVQQMTRELGYSEQKYRELIESSPEMIHIVSRDGALKLTNKIALDLLAQKEVDMAGRTVVDLVVPEQRADMKGFILTLFERGYGEGEFVFQAGDGTQIPVEIIATTITDSGQPPVMASFFSRDIRVRKRLEEGLIRSDRLAVLGQVSAGLAHEINNPLSIVLANAQDLLGEPLDEKDRRQCLDVIVKNTVRAGHIVNDLLTFTRQGPPIKAPVNLLDVIEESLLFVHSKIKAKKISVRKEIPAGGMTVYGDESQLMQLMVNLLLNSIQVLKENGWIALRVGTRDSDHRQEVLLEVEDNGPGIKASDLKRVFDPFYTTKETGFGLGLFISSTIAERHHGSIWAESREGQGTTLKVLLPSLSSDPEHPSSGGDHA
jgi:PAS domain S-box-containing protein